MNINSIFVKLTVQLEKTGRLFMEPSYSSTSSSTRPTSSAAIGTSFFITGNAKEIDEIIKNQPHYLLQKDSATGSIPLIFLLENNHVKLAHKVLGRMTKPDLRDNWLTNHSECLFKVFAIAFIRKEIEKEITPFLMHLIEVSLEKTVASYFDIEEVLCYLEMFFENKILNTENLENFKQLCLSLNRVEEIWTELKGACEKDDEHAVERIYTLFPGLIVKKDLHTHDTPLLILCRHHHWRLACKVTSWIKDLKKIYFQSEYEDILRGPFLDTNLQKESPLTFLKKFLSEKVGLKETEEANTLKEMIQAMLKRSFDKSRLEKGEIAHTSLNDLAEAELENLFSPKTLSSMTKQVESLTEKVRKTIKMRKGVFENKRNADSKKVGWLEAKDYCEEKKRNELMELISSQSYYLVKREPETQQTLLMMACEEGEWGVALDIIEQSKAHGFIAHLDADRDKKGLRALDIARNFHSTDVIDKQKLQVIEQLQALDSFMLIVNKLNEKKREGIIKVRNETDTLTFSFSDPIFLNKAKKYLRSIEAEIIEESRAEHDQTDDKEESENPIIDTQSNTIFLKVRLKRETIKNFARNFIKYWERLDNNSSSNRGGEIRIIATDANQKKGQPRSSGSNRRQEKTFTIQRKLELKKAPKEQEVKLQKTKTPVEVEIVPQPTVTAKVERLQQTILLAKEDTRKDWAPDAVIDRRNEKEEELPPRVNQKGNIAQKTLRNRNVKNRAHTQIIIGDAQRKRMKTAIIKLRDYEILRKKVQMDKVFISMYLKLALLENLMQALEALYPTSNDAIDFEDKEEKAFIEFLTNHCISRKDGQLLRNIIRSCSFIITDKDLKELMRLFDEFSLRTKLINLQNNKPGLPLSLENCAIFTKFAEWEEPFDLCKKNLFYFAKAIDCISKLKSVQMEFQTRMKQIEKQMLGKTEFYRFSQIEESLLLCDAASKLFADLHKYISKLDKGLIEKLKQAFEVRKIYDLGTKEAHLQLELLEVGGEVPSISQETLFTYLIKKNDFIFNLEACLTDVKNEYQEQTNGSMSTSSTDSSQQSFYTQPPTDMYVTYPQTYSQATQPLWPPYQQYWL